MMHLIDRYFIKQPRLRRFVTRLLEGDRERDEQLLGASIRVNSIKENGYLRASRLIRSSALLRDELATIINLASLVCDGDSFVDIGANVGIFSLNLARIHRVMPNTRLYAFEANPDTFSRLKPSAERLGIVARNVALSDHNGNLEFVAGAVSHVFTTIENTSAYSIPSERAVVECCRLDSLDLVGDSLILKIDVEGQERNVLDGALNLFLTGRVKAVYLDGYKDPTIESLLVGHGFILLNGRTLEPTGGGLFSLLAIRSSQIPVQRTLSRMEDTY